LHLFVDALPLQPCEPTLCVHLSSFIIACFVHLICPISPTARDAWIQADQNRYAGANKCLLWNAFASRGLGVGAADHVDSVDVPADC
jgi:extracellular elastinolytic metalloproteinase